jgi:predicted TPR repeat methyltransferase
MHLADVLASRGEADEAILLAEQALQQSATQANQSVHRADWLIHAAAVAQRLGQHALALQWLRQAEQLSPDEPDIRYRLGLSLTRSGEPGDAIVIFTDLLRQQSGQPALLRARLQACLIAQQTEQAILDGEALLTLEPANAEYQFYLALARGLTPETLPVSMVTSLFEGNATGIEHYIDAELQQELSRDVAQIINQWHPDRKGDVLELGCGAGLLGAALGPIDGVLVGVDLSASMMGRAAGHRVYDRFHHVNLLDALQATPENLYHVIAALDSLPYVGSLDIVVPNAYRILLDGGHFVFSFEGGADGAADYTLQSTYRYQHQLSYVQRLLQHAGFEDVVVRSRVIDRQGGAPVITMLVIARKPLQKVTKSRTRRQQSPPL